MDWFLNRFIENSILANAHCVLADERIDCMLKYIIQRAYQVFHAFIKQTII